MYLVFVWNLKVCLLASWFVSRAWSCKFIYKSTLSLFLFLFRPLKIVCLVQDLCWEPGNCIEAARSWSFFVFLPPDKPNLLTWHCRARPQPAALTLSFILCCVDLCRYPNLTVPCDNVAVDTDIGPINIVPLNPTSNFTYLRCPYILYSEAKLLTSRDFFLTIRMPSYNRANVLNHDWSPHCHLHCYKPPPQ